MRAGPGQGQLFLAGPAGRVPRVEGGAVVAAADDGVDPVCKLCDRSKGVRVDPRAAASADERVNALDQPVADQRPTRVPLWRQTGLGGWASRTRAAAQAGAGWGLGGLGVRTKQMPACRRGTSVHTLARRQKVVTTVTLSSCRILGGGRVVPSRPQPMARHGTPLPTP